MDPNSLASHLDEHLIKIELNTKTALQNLEKAGFSLDTNLLNYIKELSIDRFKLTCERFTAEAKYKKLCAATAETRIDLTSDDENTAIPIPQTEEAEVSTEQGGKATKRRADNADDAVNVQEEPVKKRRTMETTSSEDSNGDVDQSNKSVEECTQTAQVDAQEEAWTEWDKDPIRMNEHWLKKARFQTRNWWCLVPPKACRAPQKSPQT